MTKSGVTWLAAASLCVLAASAWAQARQQGQAGTLPAFLDEQTALVVRVNVDRIAVDELGKWFEGLAAPDSPDRTAATTARDNVCALVNALKAAGAKELYVVVSPAYLPQPPFFVAVPLRDGANAPAIAQAFGGGVLPATEQIRGAVCAGPKPSLDRLRAMTPAAQPILEQALARAGDGAIQVAFALTADQRRALEETLPQLPPGLGGGPSKVLTRGVLWGAASLSIGPGSSLKAVIQCQDEDAAGKAHAVAMQFLNNIGTEPGVKRAVPNYEQFIPFLTPKVAGDTLTLSVQASDVEASLKAWLLASVVSSRAEASTANMHQIFMACMVYKQDRKGEWPDTLQQLVERGLLDARTLRNPVWPAQEVGYVYRKPAKDAPARTVVLYEKHDGWPAYGVAVGFVDAAVIRLEDQEQFRRMLEQGR